MFWQYPAITAPMPTLMHTSKKCSAQSFKMYPFLDYA